MIETSELSGLLPGERTLAAKLQIGRDTLRVALEILESEEWIAPREHGKRRRILKSGTSSGTFLIPEHIPGHSVRKIG